MLYEALGAPQTRPSQTPPPDVAVIDVEHPHRRGLHMDTTLPDVSRQNGARTDMAVQSWSPHDVALINVPPSRM